MASKIAATLTRGDRVVVADEVWWVMEHRPIRCEKHSPGRVGYTLISERDGRARKLSCPDTERIELASD